MTTPRVRAALVGAGRIAAGYAADPVTARHFRYATHAQVLAAHPGLDWRLVIDPSAEARDSVRATWSVPEAASHAADLVGRGIDLVVIATPPVGRLELVRSLGDVKAIVLEKPMGADAAEARALLEHCEAQGTLVQVAFWRRADAGMQALAGGRMRELIGAPVAATGVYGNGVRNNGSHMIDLVRMLVGEIDSVQALDAPRAAGPLPSDADLPFALRLRSGAVATLHPISFGVYRENALAIWGERGRLEILQEGLRCAYYPVRDHRAMSGAREIASEAPTEIPTGASDALYRLYDNALAALGEGQALWSPGRSALRTELAVDALLSQSGPSRAEAVP